MSTINPAMQQQMFSFQATPNGTGAPPPQIPAQIPQQPQFIPFTPGAPGAAAWASPSPAGRPSAGRSRGRPSKAQQAATQQTPSAVPAAMMHPGYLPGVPGMPGVATMPMGVPPMAMPPPPMPVPRSHPLPTTPQAMHSSYASRMGTGASMLVQPIINPNQQREAPAQVVGATTGRQRKTVNYAEAGSDEDFADSDADGSDDDDDGEAAPRRRRNRKKRDRGGDAAGGDGGNSGMPVPAKVEELDKSYLGMVPPAKFVVPKPAAKTAHVYYPQPHVDRESRKTAILIPIRIEIDTETQRIRDAFVWNLNEELITPEHFARAFCVDLGIPEDRLKGHIEQISASIRAQLEEHAPVAAMDLRGGPEDEEELIVDPNDEDVPEPLPDVRVILSLDVQLDARHLIDHVEWDLLSPLLPEDFARALCADIGLSGEAVPLVAHAVHEELLKHKRDALEWGIVEDVAGAFVRNVGLGGGGWGKQSGMPRRLKSVWREWNEIEEYGYAPRLEILSHEELERREMERERASRRMRRETSRFSTNAATTTGRRRR